MVRSTATTTAKSTSSDDSLALLNETLNDNKESNVDSFIIGLIRTYVKHEFSSLLSKLKLGLIDDLASELTRVLNPLYKLIDRLPSATLKDAIKGKIGSFIDSIKTDLQ